MTRMPHRLVGPLAVILIALNAPAYAWNPRGHMMVAAVAYSKLKPAVKGRVQTILLLNPDRPNWVAMIPAGTSPANKKKMLFMIAATWPDRIKGNAAYHDDGPDGGNRPPTDGTADRNTGFDDFARHKYWHFVDQPFSTDGTTLAPVPTPNAQTQILAFRTVLASTNQDTLKAYDLSWLLHLVGDVHQPLHCTARFSSDLPDGDQGGNLVKLNGNPHELHAFWDAAGGTSNDLASIIAAANSLPVALEGSMDAAVWIDESFNAAKSRVYKAPIGPGKGPFTVTAAYKTAATKLANKRIALAGARLAKILNDELK